MRSVPPPPPKLVRPMSAFGAFWWTFAITLSFLWLLSLAGAIRPAALEDERAQVAAQAIGYALGLFAILRVYAPEASIRQFLALRPTATALYPLSLGLGLSLALPLSWVFERILSRFPLDQPSSFADTWAQAGGARRALLLVLIAGVGPFVEEVLFRGALFLPVRRYAEEGHPLSLRPTLDSLRRAASDSPELQRQSEPRASAGLDAVMVTTGLFVLVHMRWQQFLAILPAALVMGLLRQRSGSLWPSFLLHVGFNAMPFVADLIIPDAVSIPISWVIGGAVSSSVLLLLALRALATPAAAAAREAELS